MPRRVIEEFMRACRPAICVPVSDRCLIPIVLDAIPSDREKSPASQGKGERELRFMA